MIPRLVWSPFAAETLAIVDLLEEGFLVKTKVVEVCRLTSGSLDMVLVTDSQSLEKTLKTTTPLKEAGEGHGGAQGCMAGQSRHAGGPPHQSREELLQDWIVWGLCSREASSAEACWNVLYEWIQ